MIHLRRYWSKGGAKLAADAGVSKSTISQLLRGKSHPLYSTARRVVKCLGREFGKRLDIDEVFSDDGCYPTRHVCALMGCSGCNHEGFYHQDNRLKPSCRPLERGRWTGDVFELDEPSPGDESQ